MQVLTGALIAMSACALVFLGFVVGMAWLLGARAPGDNRQMRVITGFLLSLSALSVMTLVTVFLLLLDALLTPRGVI